MKTITYFFLIVCISIISCDFTPKPSNTADRRSTEERAREQTQRMIDSIKTSVKTKGAGTWTYDSTMDKMTDKNTVTAIIKSKDILELDFPYNGGSICSLTLRDSPKYGIDCILQINDGQFNYSYDDTYITCRFDEEPAVKWNCSRASDGSSNVLFMKNSKRFIEKLKRSDKTLVEFDLYQNGIHTVEFITSGLIWK
jgi:hypothetical protein